MFSSSAKAASGYDKTVKNMLINKNTRVVCQGFTGKQVKSFTNFLGQTCTVYCGRDAKATGASKYIRKQ